MTGFGSLPEASDSYRFATVDERCRREMTTQVVDTGPTTLIRSPPRSGVTGVTGSQSCPFVGFRGKHPWDDSIPARGAAAIAALLVVVLAAAALQQRRRRLAAARATARRTRPKTRRSRYAEARSCTPSKATRTAPGIRRDALRRRLPLDRGPDHLRAPGDGRRGRRGRPLPPRDHHAERRLHGLHPEAP